MIAMRKQKLQLMWTSHIKSRKSDFFQLPGPGSYHAKDYMFEDPTFRVQKFSREPRYKNLESIQDQIHKMNIEKVREVTKKLSGRIEYTGCKH